MAKIDLSQVVADLSQRVTALERRLEKEATGHARP